MGVKREADVSMAGCQASTTLSRKGERKGKDKEKGKKKISTVETWIAGPGSRGHLNHCQAGRCCLGMSHSGSCICEFLGCIQDIPSLPPFLAHLCSPRALLFSFFPTTPVTQVEPSLGGALPGESLVCSLWH